jgi:hypothetical protein
MSFSRLSDAKEIQAAFRREVDALFGEIGMESLFTDKDTSIIDTKKFWGIFDSVPGHTLQSVGFKPEHTRILKTLAFLLEQCARVEATKQNLKIFEPLFHPAKPTTPVVAEAYEEVVMVVEQSIGPK